MLLSPINSCSLHIILHEVFCSCIQVAVCLPIFFPNKTNIGLGLNTHTKQIEEFQNNQNNIIVRRNKIS